MSNTEEQPNSGLQELENGIFNMTVTTVQFLQQQHPSQVARNHVASYLERLAHQLRELEETPSGDDV